MCRISHLHLHFFTYFSLYLLIPFPLMVFGFEVQKSLQMHGGSFLANCFTDDSIHKFFISNGCHVCILFICIVFQHEAPSSHPGFPSLSGESHFSAGLLPPGTAGRISCSMCTWTAVWIFSHCLLKGPVTFHKLRLADRLSPSSFDSVSVSTY